VSLILKNKLRSEYVLNKKPELSAAMKRKVEPKNFTKNPILGTKYTIAVSSAKGRCWKIDICY
jgi:ATP-binding protein involved in chromosome partitioning